MGFSFHNEFLICEKQTRVVFCWPIRVQLAGAIPLVLDNAPSGGKTDLKDLCKEGLGQVTLIIPLNGFKAQICG